MVANGWHGSKAFSEFYRLRRDDSSPPMPRQAEFTAKRDIRKCGSETTPTRVFSSKSVVAHAYRSPACDPRDPSVTHSTAGKLCRSPGLNPCPGRRRNHADRLGCHSTLVDGPLTVYSTKIRTVLLTTSDRRSSVAKPDNVSSASRRRPKSGPNTSPKVGERNVVECAVLNHARPKRGRRCGTFRAWPQRRRSQQHRPKPKSDLCSQCFTEKQSSPSEVGLARACRSEN